MFSLKIFNINKEEKSISKNNRQVCHRVGLSGKFVTWVKFI